MIDESERLVVGPGETFVATGGGGWLIQCRSVQHCSLEARAQQKIRAKGFCCALVIMNQGFASGVV